MSRFEVVSERMKQTLEMPSEPVGVFLLPGPQHMAPFAEFRRLETHRYCQSLMRARSGECVLLDAEGLACPAAAAAFGFRPLPQALASGDGLVAFGIVSEAGTGQRMFEEMPRLAAGSIVGLALMPLHLVPRLPDVVVVEAAVESLMWLLLADLNLNAGVRRNASTAVLQATCVDATIIPYTEQRLNFSYGCYGCREATDMAPGETVLGFPGTMLDRLMKQLEQLNQKAIAKSRAKGAYEHIMAGNTVQESCAPGVPHAGGEH
jgi:uncharacterized protein (DUF169 family)